MLLSANAMIQKDPGVIIGPISQFMGWIIDFVFNFVYPITEKNSLGISIIILTIIMRLIMVPLAIKSQKSMAVMQKLNPEVEKIRKKYGDSKDPEVQRKMNTEIQALYSKNKVNPLSGCLPLLIQMPIFFALTYLMNQSFLFIAKLRDVYGSLAQAITQVPHWTGFTMNVGLAHIPTSIASSEPNGVFDLDPLATGSFHNLEKVLNKLSATDWDKLLHGDPAAPLVESVKQLASPQAYENIVQLLTQKQNMENFFGLNLLEAAGIGFPGIIIPLTTAVTTFLSSWLSMKMTNQTNKDSNAVMQQRIMMFAMPLMMAFFTVNSPAGVGIYWITSNIFQVGQQAFLNKYYGIHLSAKKEDSK
ncbi:MAG: YidC/Oxa1 family membrane protein insertase [Clostridiales bacterium]|nr:YidC/Oxa1 family membrane protein insertase [Clostridiales bacterium]